MLARVDHRNADARKQGHGAFALTLFQQGLCDFLRGAEILFVGRENAQRKRGGFVPLAVFQIEVEQEFGRLSTFFKVRHRFQDLRRLGEIADRGERACFDDQRVEILGIEMQRLVGQLLAFGLVTASQGPLCGSHITLKSFPRLPHCRIEIRQANLDAEIVWFGQEQFLKKSDRLWLLVVFQVKLGELQEKRAAPQT